MPIATKPCGVLSDNLFLLPAAGTALDLACGLGANAMLLAQQGLTTQAWDISDVGLQRLQQHVEAQALTVKTCAGEIKAQSFSADSFDVIVISRFLDRSICDAIMGSLKLGGLLFYQTYTQQKTTEEGPRNPAYLLEENELLQMFSSLQLVFYRENASLGKTQQGLRNEAQFIGQKIKV